MNITILSGGTGNDSLVTGLKQFYPDANIKVIVNAYDNGKSTGVCRTITNTLGVSDIRKNHIRMYKATAEIPDQRLIEFLENRYDLTPGEEYVDVSKYLRLWGLPQLDKYAQAFFSNPLASQYTYKSFNIANIIYSQMYKELGYEETNQYFCKLLGIDDFVILNSFDNIYIGAVTADGTIIDDEGAIVDYRTNGNPIIKLTYDYSQGNCVNGLNRNAVEAVLDADILIISTGTFWSSIYPTLEYLNFYSYVNLSKAKKIWAINNEEDGDSYGVTSNMFIGYMQELGLHLKDFTILENSDAKATLREVNSTYADNIAIHSMGNTAGKHDGYKYVKAILRIFYNLDYLRNYDKVIFDFDDTLWSRKPELMNFSVENIKLLNAHADKYLIISGNSYKSIHDKLSIIYGTDLNDFNVDIWADANTTLYRHADPIEYYNDIILNNNYMDIVDQLKMWSITDVEVNNSEHPAYIKIKPLTELERTLLVNLLDSTIFNSNNDINYHAKAISSGFTTVDIIHEDNTKGKLFEYTFDRFDGDNILYLGDEFDSGNDRDIAKLCKQAICVRSAKETNIILKLLED
jgi:2-phospho-L-lactate transferase/gluconeogenesis factor (CofD/UPF0052 family)/hydroxymethylpyrimidine pyrophosphatase-like HAD family hydrolase